MPSMIGAGLPYWLPAGAAIRHAMESYIAEVERRAGYQQVYSPVLAKRELYEISPSLGISPEELDRIEKAAQGEGLLVTTGRRVWVNLYGHTSPGEFEMANTDVVADTGGDRRNGHAAKVAAYAAR